MSGEALSALTVWRREIGRGQGGQSLAPRTWRKDALWRAACHEAAALEYDGMGLPEAAERLRDRAAEIILDGDCPPEAA